MKNNLVKVNAERLGVCSQAGHGKNLYMCVLLQNKGTKAKEVIILILSDLLKLGFTDSVVTI